MSFVSVPEATHYVVVEEVPEGVVVVLLMPSEPEEGCEAEGMGECRGAYWQPLNQEGGPGPCCEAHVGMGGPGVALPLPAPANAHTHLAY